ncbi:hypothetical protein [Flagellimonas marinaquae]|uniref:hypothetical protein n=1 Tax=Flagellimonas marinaquae TaxID=254955 RepID=UPI000F8D4C16|nr:hypothetical protein [Allomuricauda aquimarina]
MSHLTQFTTKEQQALVMRVERNHRMVQRLNEKLKSYTHEPKCPRRFEKFYELNKSIQNFKKYDARIMSIIRQRHLDFGDLDQKEVENHINRFKKLESDFASYLLELDKPL